MPGFKFALVGDAQHFQPLVCLNQTVGNTAAALASVPATARGAVISGDGSANAIRMTLDGTTPTATLGVRLDGTDTVMIVSRAALETMKLIREDGSDVVISVQFFR